MSICMLSPNLRHAYQITEVLQREHMHAPDPATGFAASCVIHGLEMWFSAWRDCCWPLGITYASRLAACHYLSDSTPCLRATPDRQLVPLPAYSLWRSAAPLVPELARCIAIGAQHSRDSVFCPSITYRLAIMVVKASVVSLASVLLLSSSQVTTAQNVFPASDVSGAFAQPNGAELRVPTSTARSGTTTITRPQVTGKGKLLRMCGCTRTQEPPDQPAVGEIRAISDKWFKDGVAPSSYGFSNLVWAWGQFIGMLLACAQWFRQPWRLVMPCLRTCA